MRGPKGQPGRTDPSVRQLERDVAGLTATDPYVNGGAVVPLTERLADPVEEKALHMVNSDPARTPTFTMFANDDFFFQTTNPSCGANPCVNPGFAWNHGDFQHEIANTWVGMVGPGVSDGGVDSSTWTDHTNVRPTMLALLGLSEDYLDDGRVLIEGLDAQATPQALLAHRDTVRRLGAAYEQLNASFGDFALETLDASTKAIESSDESTYNQIEDAIASLTERRDALAGKIKSELSQAAFDGQALDEAQAKSEIDEANRLIDEARGLAS